MKRSHAAWLSHGYKILEALEFFLHLTIIIVSRVVPSHIHKMSLLDDESEHGVTEFLAAAYLTNPFSNTIHAFLIPLEPL